MQALESILTLAIVLWLQVLQHIIRTQRHHTNKDKNILLEITYHSFNAVYPQNTLLI